MIRRALLVLCLVAACGKSNSKSTRDGVGSGSTVATPVGVDPVERLRRDTGVTWRATQHADGTVLLAPDTPEPPRSGARPVIAKAFLASYGDAIGLSQLVLVPGALSRDPAIVAFGQTAHGLPVIGASIVVQFAADGGVESVSGRRIADIAPPDPDASRDPAFSLAAFENHVATLFEGFDASWLATPPSAVLAWWAPGIAAPQLAFVVTAKLAPQHGGFELGAVVGLDGTVFAYSDGRRHVQGSGQGAWGTKTFELEASGSRFAMRRALAGGWPASCGAAPAKQPMIEIRHNDAIVSSASVDGPWDGTQRAADRVMVDAYDHTERALRYFRDRFCRNSFDGVGSDLPVHIAPGGALWTSSYMRLGPGVTDEHGIAWLADGATLEVVTHEVMHGIVNTALATAKVWPWEATFQSDDVEALAEGLGDVFGQLAEEHHDIRYGSQPRKLGQIGENWVVAAGRYLRKFDDASATFTERHADEHDDSLPISSAFYRMVTGDEKLTLQQAESVWYGALAKLRPSTTFASFAHDTLIAAATMNRTNAQIPTKPIACAWVSVGVLLRADVSSQWKIDCASPGDDTLAGHWDWTLGDWGTMSFARAGEETKHGKKVVIVRGVYTYRSGTVLLRCDEALRSCTGRWFEGSRACGTRGEEGDAAFAVASPGALDGKWLHVGETAWRQNWDLERSKQPIPDEDKKRLADDTLFRCK